MATLRLTQAGLADRIGAAGKAIVYHQFRPGRHVLSASNYRTVMRHHRREWDIITETTAFSAAA
jgi:hypothetical protein